MQIKGKVKSCIKVPSLGILGLLAIAMICPVAPEEAQAADTPVSAGGDSLSISVSNGVLELEADPTVNDGIALGTVRVSAKTTNETGYTMSLSTFGGTAMTSTDTKNTATIPTLASNTVLTNFPANRWGYHFGATPGTTSSTYKPFPTAAAELESTTYASNVGVGWRLTIAAKINNALPADTYTAKLVVSVTVNAPKDVSAYLTTMQAMTSSICSSIPEGLEGQLEDTRDNQMYYVGKMKDGRCWMLQNLALGSTSTTAPLTSTDSNVTSSWSLPQQLTSATSGSTTNTATQSWNFGKWILATPLLTTSCDNVSFSGCTRYGFVDVSNATNFQPTYTATTGTWNGATVTNNTLVTVNCTTWSGSGTSKKCTAGTYDPHYLAGNYYSWNAATAGTGGTRTSGQATGSICPKGWKLPISNSTTVGSFAGLLSQYGVSSSLSGTVSGTTYDIAGSPLRFVRGGFVDPSYNLSAVGAGGRYWSSTPNSNSGDAYFLNFTNFSYGVNPSDYSDRYVGQSVRCIAE